MEIFVAHTDEDKDFAIEIVQRLREAKHDAIAGEQVRFAFSRFSFSDRNVAAALRSADALVALGLNWSWHENVAAEIAYFGGHKTGDRTVLVTRHEFDKRTPAYLLGSRVVYFEGNPLATIDQILTHINAMDKIHQRASKQVFLSYSRLDLTTAREIYAELEQHKNKVWFDERSLIGGQQWDIEIERAITESKAFVPLLSSTAISKRGYFQKELRKSLSVAEEMPEGSTYIIPVLLDSECADVLPQGLKKYHCLFWGGSLDYGGLRGALNFALGVDFDEGFRRHF